MGRLLPMIQIEACFLAMRVVDVQGRLDAQGLFVDHLMAPGLPTHAPQLALVFRLAWGRVEATMVYDGKIEVVAPSGEIAHQLWMKVEAFPTAGTGRKNQILKMDGMVFKEHGTHRVRVSFGDVAAECVYNVMPASEA